MPVCLHLHASGERPEKLKSVPLLQSLPQRPSPPRHLLTRHLTSTSSTLLKKNVTVSWSNTARVIGVTSTFCLFSLSFSFSFLHLHISTRSSFHWAGSIKSSRRSSYVLAITTERSKSCDEGLNAFREEGRALWVLWSRRRSVALD